MSSDRIQQNNHVTIMDTNSVSEELADNNEMCVILRQTAINDMPSRKHLVGTFRRMPIIMRMTGVRNKNSPTSENNEDELDESDSLTPLLEEYTQQIVRQLEEDEAFMQDNPMGQELRRQALQDLPHNLTVKRKIKSYLGQTVKRRKSKPISFSKQVKYRCSMAFSKTNTAINNFKYNYELWYGILKKIEGNYGSGVATYFRFLRSIFIMNLFLLFTSGVFLILPQILYLANVKNENITSEVNDTKVRNFKISDIITGEGYFTDTPLYYGNYINTSFSLNGSNFYNIPFAYFFTMFFCYIICFIALSIEMAKSYRKNYIETSGGLKNIFAHKIFCSWDFSITSEKSAALKCQAINKELRELLSENKRNYDNLSFMEKFQSFMVKTSVNIVVIVLLIFCGFFTWLLLKHYHTNFQVTNMNYQTTDRLVNDRQEYALVTSFVITLFMNAIPKFFSYIVRYESYSSPRISLYITLGRTFLLGTVIVSVLIWFWLNRTYKSECWETSLGQEIYRLIIMDLLFSIFISFSLRICHYYLYTKVPNRFASPHFDISHNTFDLIYSQTLFWVGFYFSPLLSLIIVLKMFCQFHVQRISVLHFCQPGNKSWRAAQMNTIFLVMAVFSLFSVIIIYGYIITKVPTSTCGPFRDYEYFYQIILEGIFSLKKGHSSLKIIMYLTKPGIVGAVLIAMCVWVYYIRAKSKAQIAMVKILREMLIWESKDKEFLLNSIARLSEKESIRNYDFHNMLNGRNNSTGSTDFDTSTKTSKWRYYSE